MKNIKKKIVLIIVAVLLLASRIGIASTPVMEHTENNPYSVDLFAGQHIDVGDVIVWNNADSVYVNYSLIDGWCLTETHLHVATSLEGIPQTQPNKKGNGGGNPIPGHFDYKGEHDCLSTFTYEIPLTWNMDDLIYIAAHAEVQGIIGYETPDLIAFKDALPNQVTMNVTYPYTGGPAYFPETTISGGTNLDGVYEGWCVDTDNVISTNIDYTANVYSSYEELPIGLIEGSGNLDLVNWIINQGFIGQPSTCGEVYTYGDIQRAIWTLVEDVQLDSGLGPWSQCKVDEILAAAQANGESFEPECGDSIAVILEPLDCDQVAQVILIDVGLECIPIYQSETAWGDGYEFPGKNWATYFIYTVQGVDIPEVWPEGGTLSIAYEDLPIGGGNDWDYNDFVVDIDVLAIFFGISADRDLIQMNFTIRPEAKMAGYTHVMHLDADTFDSDGTYELYRDGCLVESGAYIDDIGIDVILVPNTGSYPNEVILTINFDGPCDFLFPVWDHNLYHGENLFYDPYLHVQNTGQDIHTGDYRMLTVPIDWAWPTPDGNAIWNVYPKVTAGSPPSFVPYWWTP